jgi:xylulose-5-phosphate/fructose-6-phosphate phosphoketolase
MSVRYTKAMNPVRPGPLCPELLHRINAYWWAANFLSVGQLHLNDNPLLKKPLELSHMKPFVVGPWGTTPGQPNMARTCRKS